MIGDAENGDDDRMPSSESLISLPRTTAAERDALLLALDHAAADLPTFRILLPDAEAARQLPEAEEGTGQVALPEFLGLSVPVVETLVTRGSEHFDASLYVWLILFAGLPGRAESIAAQIAFGREAGRGHSDRFISGKVDRIPDEVRMLRGIAFLRRAAALSQEQARAPLLCMIAWLMWARGKRALASAYTGEALRIEPGHALAGALTRQFTVRSPAWIRAV